jgi:hypothetical protein
LRTSLTWTTADGRATDLVYDVLADRVDRRVGAVHLTMTPRWGGRSRVTDMIDGAGAWRLVPTGGVGGSEATIWSPDPVARTVARPSISAAA